MVEWNTGRTAQVWWRMGLWLWRCPSTLESWPRGWKSLDREGTVTVPKQKGLSLISVLFGKLQIMLPKHQLTSTIHLWTISTTGTHPSGRHQAKTENVIWRHQDAKLCNVFRHWQPVEIAGIAAICDKDIVNWGRLFGCRRYQFAICPAHPKLK